MFVLLYLCLSWVIACSALFEARNEVSLEAKGHVFQCLPRLWRTNIRKVYASTAVWSGDLMAQKGLSDQCNLNFSIPYLMVNSVVYQVYFFFLCYSWLTHPLSTCIPVLGIARHHPFTSHYIHLSVSIVFRLNPYIFCWQNHRNVLVNTILWHGWELPWRDRIVPKATRRSSVCWRKAKSEVARRRGRDLSSLGFCQASCLFYLLLSILNLLLFVLILLLSILNLLLFILNWLLSILNWLLYYY